MPTDPEDHVVRMIDLNTTSKQPDAMRPEVLFGSIVKHSNLSQDDAEFALNKALEKGRVEETEDGRLKIVTQLCTLASAVE